jgi:hypothetical protein
VIDDMDGIDAAYEYAGIVGIKPHGMTLRQLWRMACGAMKQKRIESLQLICLAFNDSMDTQKFLDFGLVVESNVGKPLVLSPELEAKVQAEIDRIRRENPNLPQYNTVG